MTDLFRNTLPHHHYATATAEAQVLANTHKKPYCVEKGYLVKDCENAIDDNIVAIFPPEYQGKPVTLTEYIKQLKSEHNGEYPFDGGFRDACDRIISFLED